MWVSPMSRDVTLQYSPQDTESTEKSTLATTLYHVEPCFAATSAIHSAADLINSCVCTYLPAVDSGCNTVGGTFTKAWFASSGATLSTIEVLFTSMAYVNKVGGCRGNLVGWHAINGVGMHGV